MENIEWKISDVQFESDILNPGLAVSPWCGHRNFIYDYLKYIRPKKIVELGTHYGCSFFAMCQSLKDNGLNSELFAVDTWKGDPQAGFYGNDVWELVNKTRDKYFSRQNTHLMRMLFAEAADQFEDETFDLIHIDGLHTYEAVSEDFKTWLPKLKQNGVIMFHDVDSKLKYGTNTFWEEIKGKYRYYFEFKHSWGLGILFPKGEKIYTLLLENNFIDKLQIYTYKALYAYETIKTRDLTNMADERFAAINEQTKMIDERDATISAQEKMIDERDTTILAQKKLIDEKDEGIHQQTKMIDERDITILAQKKLIDEKDEGIRQQTKMIDERDITILAQKKLIDEKDEGIKKQTELIDERDEQIRNQKIVIDEDNEKIKQFGVELEVRQKKNLELEKKMQQLYEALNKHRILAKIIIKEIGGK